MLSKLLSSSRYMILIAVLGSAVAATVLLLYGGTRVLLVIAETLQKNQITGKEAKLLALALIETVDLFLLGTVFYIIALGLYELFIDTTIQVPDWLEIRNLDDLKYKLVNVVIVVLGVLFLGQVVSWDGQRDLLPFGAAIALVIAALTFFLGQKNNKEKP